MELPSKICAPSIKIHIVLNEALVLLLEVKGTNELPADPNMLKAFTTIIATTWNENPQWAAKLQGIFIT